MNKQNKLYKFLRIIFLTLAIISLVFGLLKKVGLCASDSTSSDDYASSFPLRINPNYGMGELPSDFDYNQFMSAVLGACPWAPDVCAVNEVSPTYIDLQCFQFGNRAGFEVTSSAFSDFKWRFGVQATVMVRYTFSSGSAVVTNTYGSGNSAIGSTYTSLDSLPDSTQFVKQHTFIFLYPVYVANGYLSYNGVTYFENWSSSGGGDSGFDAPGFSEGFQDWVDSNLNPVDTTQPSDPTSTPSWLGKILDGIGNINNTIGGWFTTINNNINGFFTWVKEPFDQEAFSDEFNSIPIISDFNDLGDLIEDSGMFDWSDVTPANRVAFTFDFGGSVLPHTTTEINFDWYTGTVKTVILALISTFLVLGLLVTIFNQLPNIIGGKSGDKGGGSDS